MLSSGCVRRCPSILENARLSLLSTIPALSIGVNTSSILVGHSRQRHEIRSWLANLEKRVFQVLIMWKCLARWHILRRMTHGHFLKMLSGDSLKRIQKGSATGFYHLFISSKKLRLGTTVLFGLQDDCKRQEHSFSVVTFGGSGHDEGGKQFSVQPVRGLFGKVFESAGIDL